MNMYWRKLAWIKKGFKRIKGVIIEGDLEINYPEIDL